MMATLGSHFLCSDLSVRLHSSHCDGDAWAEKLTTHYYERNQNLPILGHNFGHSVFSFFEVLCS